MDETTETASVFASVSVCVTGSTACGKTSFIRRTVHDTFDYRAIPTITMMWERMILHTKSGVDVRMTFVDTSGQDRLHSACRQAYRDVCAVIVMVDMSPDGTPMGNDSEHWLDEAKKHTPSTVPVILVGNKVDTIRGQPGTMLYDAALEKHGVTEFVLQKCYSGEIFYISSKSGDGIPDLLSALRRIAKNTHEFQHSLKTLADMEEGYMSDGGVSGSHTPRHIGGRMPLLAVVSNRNGEIVVEKGRGLIIAGQGDPLERETILHQDDPAYPRSRGWTLLRDESRPSSKLPSCSC